MWKLKQASRVPSSTKVRDKLRKAEPAEEEEQMTRLGLIMELLKVKRRGIDFYRGEKDNEQKELITIVCVN